MERDSGSWLALSKEPWRWLAPLLVVLVAAGIYANTLGCGFTFDDHWLIVDNERISSPGYVRYQLLETRLWRPLKRISLKLDHSLWGTERPAGFHATNVALHAAACLALYAFVLRLGLGRRVASLTALLFALHPVHVEAVANISHRKESMALLFTLLGFIAYLKARAPTAPRGPVSLLVGRLVAAGGALGRAEFLVYTGLCYLAGLLSKEAAAVMLPATIIAWELLLAPGDRRRRLRQLLPWFLPMLAVVAVMGFLSELGTLHRCFREDQIYWITEGQTTEYLPVLLSSFKAFASYVRLLVWPWPLYVDRDMPLAEQLGEGGVLVGLAFIALYLLALVASARRAPVAGFALAWFGLNLLPVSNLVPVTSWLVAERFLYVPSVGFLLLVALGLDALWSRHRSAGVALAVSLCLVYGILTLRQNRVWKNDETLWSHTLRHHPRSFRGLYSVGQVAYERGDLEEAERLYRGALSEQPYYYEALLALGRLLFEADRNQEALEYAKRAVEQGEDEANAWVLLGRVAHRLGDHEQSRQALQRALELKPTQSATVRNLARGLFLSGRREEALELLGSSPALERDAAMLVLHGQFLLTLGRTDEALESYERAAELAPESTQPLNAMARLLLRAGRFDEAREALERSLVLDPEQPREEAQLQWLRQRTPRGRQ